MSSCTGCKGGGMANKFMAIVSGWTKMIFKDKRIEKIANDRALKCSLCSHLSAIGFCDICICYVKAKVRAMDEDAKGITLTEECPLPEATGVILPGQEKLYKQWRVAYIAKS